MNLKKSKKYGFAPEDVEPKSLSNKRFKTVFNMRRIKKLKDFTTDLISTIRKKIL